MVNDIELTMEDELSEIHNDSRVDDRLIASEKMEYVDYMKKSGMNEMKEWFSTKKEKPLKEATVKEKGIIKKIFDLIGHVQS